jgi:1,4-dihydroxy-2-naphthoate octaprenyltransferase
VALIFGGLGVALGAVIVFAREPAALWLGAVGLALGWSYHGPPLQLAYRGLGELDVVLCYGPLIALSTYVIQTGEWSWIVFWLSLPLGICTAAFLWVNEFPDYLADRACGKRNLVVRLGRRAASRALPAIYAMAFAVVAALPATGLPATVLLGLAGLPTAAWASARVWAEPDAFHRRYPVQAAALATFVLHALGTGAGVLLGAP